MLDITDVPGVLLGHWTHHSGTTGCSVLVFPQGARAGGAVPGHAPGSRELGLLDPRHLAEDVHAFALSGGSAFGLAVADGVMGVLADEGIGFPTSVGPVPLVPTAILFDLPVAAVRPDAQAGRQATREALSGGPVETRGLVGAGAGARVGKILGDAVRCGLGSACLEVGGYRVGALAAVNAFGCVRRAEVDAWFPAEPSLSGASQPLEAESRGNTTLVLVATDAPLSRSQCSIAADMATAGLARAVAPVYTPFDGDTVLLGATGAGAPLDPVALMRLGHVASEVVRLAIGRSADHAAQRRST